MYKCILYKYIYIYLLCRCIIYKYNIYYVHTYSECHELGENLFRCLEIFNFKFRLSSACALTLEACQLLNYCELILPTSVRKLRILFNFHLSEERYDVLRTLFSGFRVVISTNRVGAGHASSRTGHVLYSSLRIDRGRCITFVTIRVQRLTRPGVRVRTRFA